MTVALLLFAAGFIAGYTTAFLNRHIRLHKNLEGLKPVLILPLLATAVTGLLMVYVVGVPVAAAERLAVTVPVDDVVGDGEPEADGRGRQASDSLRTRCPLKSAT